MAGRYSKTELKAILQNSVRSIVMTEGIENVTVRKVSKGCGLSDPYIYQCYDNLKELMTDAFLTIDQQIVEIIEKSVERSYKNDIKNLETVVQVTWTDFWNYLMKSPESSVFYWRFLQSAYYTEEVQNLRREDYKKLVDFTKSVGREIEGVLPINDALFVTNVIEGILYSAVRIHLGIIEATEEIINTLRLSLFGSVHYLVQQKDPV